MRRRDFMTHSIGASLLAFLTGQEVMARGSEGAKGQTPGALSALNPVSQYAESYVGPRGVLDTSRRQSLTFDVVGWRTDKGRQIVSTPVLGEITVKRSPLPGAVEYEVAQRLGKDETMTGNFRCLADRRHSLERWQFQYALDSKRRNIASMSRTEQSGRREGNKIITVTDGAETVSTSSAPLLCRWGLLDVACRMAELCGTGDRFTVLHEPTGLRPDQRFREDRRGTVGREGETSIRTFLQTGPATVPTHWIVDSQGRPLFVSVFLVSLALKEIG
ncbi:MAG: hypothetical protein AMJ65_12170 [Phycisphaerae bacterium SG8_4]|nr:MAG: hypothetical protein AMJ65_12170 [Phycisphaerae bacterium SG8_4]